MEGSEDGSCGIGLPPAGQFHIDVDPNQLCFKKQGIQGTLVSSLADVDRTLDFARRGLLKPIYTVYPLSKFDEAVQKLRRGEIAGRLWWTSMRSRMMAMTYLNSAENSMAEFITNYFNTSGHG